MLAPITPVPIQPILVVPGSIAITLMKYVPCMISCWQSDVLVAFGCQLSIAHRALRTILVLSYPHFTYPGEQAVSN